MIEPDRIAKHQPIFRPFDSSGPLAVYFRNLPHWRQPGATYFVTFRLDDSIPAKVLAAWLDQRDRFYRAHNVNVRLKVSDPAAFNMAYRRIPVGIRRLFEREQAKILHEELDRCRGCCLLQYPAPRKIVVESLSHFHGERLWLGDWVVMPNHIHALLIVMDDSELEDLIGSIKKWTSRRIGEWLESQPLELQPDGPFHLKSRLWQYESYDRIVRDLEELTSFRRYIARNPEAANLHAGRFEYGAASWLDQYAERPTVA